MYPRVKICIPHRYPWLTPQPKTGGVIPPLPDPRYAHLIKPPPARITRFVEECKDITVLEHSVCRHELFRVRNQLCNNRQGFTHILFCDTDMEPRREHLEKLLSADRPVVSALARQKTMRNQYICGYKVQVPDFTLTREFDVYMPDTIESLNCTGLQQRDFTGAGFLLIECEVFDTLPRPWFRHEFINDDQTSEDIGFCINCINHGYHIWVDFDCEVPHLPDAEEVIE